MTRGAKLTKAQQDARMAILRDIERSGGWWSHLHDRGHHYSQVMACVRRGDLEEHGRYEYSLAPSGRSALARATEPKP